MLITVSGISKTDKISSATLLASLTSDYNYLIMTAQILDVNGTVLWEYPNFRSRLLTYDPMINLQYPDFSEADANLATTANVKFKTLDGIKRALEQKRKDLLLRETQETEVYGKQFDEMLSFIKYNPDGDKKDVAAPAEIAKPSQTEKLSTPAQEQVKATETAKQPVATPAVEPPKTTTPEITRVPVLQTPTPAPPAPAASDAAPAEEIVPAK